MITEQCFFQHLWLLLLQPFYGSLDFVQHNPGKPVPEETFTHSHQSWSSIIPYLLTPSVTIYGILPVQVTCLTVILHNLCPSFLWSTSWSGTLNFILHTFLHPIIVFFLQHMPIPSQPVIQVSLWTLYLELLSFSLTPHMHLSIDPSIHSDLNNIIH